MSDATDTFLSVSELEAFLLDGRSAMEPASEGGRDLPSPSAVLALAVVGLTAALRRRK